MEATMADDDKSKPPTKSATDAPGRSIPQGYRQGIVTAITVLLGFSLTFLRFWSFEASGVWSWRSVVSTGLLVVAVMLLIFSLFRSLRLEDDEPDTYRHTVRWFIASVIALLLGLLFSAIEAAS